MDAIIVCCICSIFSEGEEYNGASRIWCNREVDSEHAELVLDRMYPSGSSGAGLGDLSFAFDILTTYYLKDYD
jgi:hypothetical protein